MTDAEILRKALERYRNTTCNNTAFKDDVIVFLEKEIDRYRDRLARMEENAERLAERVKSTNDFSESIAGAVQELSNRHDALTGRVEQLGQMVESKMDQVLGDTVQTLTTFVEERTSDGGTMTLTTKTADWRMVHSVLLHAGYYVCCHYDDDNEETITIEYFRA